MVGSKVRGRGWCRVNGGGCWSGGGIQGGCEPRIEVIVNMKKKSCGWGWGGEGVWSGGRGGGGQGLCVQRNDFFVKMQKKLGGGSGWMCKKNLFFL